MPDKEVMPLITDDNIILHCLEKKFGFTWRKLICEAIKEDVIGKEVEEFLLELVDGNRVLQRDANLKWHEAVLEVYDKAWNELLEKEKELSHWAIEERVRVEAEKEADRLKAIINNTPLNDTRELLNKISSLITELEGK